MIENIHDNWDYLLSTCCSAPTSRHYYGICSKCMKKARFYLDSWEALLHSQGCIF